MRLLAATLVMTMSTSGMAGMGLSTRRWKQLRAHGSFLGVFRDYRGPRAAFVVEDGTGTLLGPLDLDAPDGPGWGVPPGPEPRGFSAGDHVEVVYAAIVDAGHPFGLPPNEDLSKRRADRAAGDPADGMFVSMEKQGAPRAIATRDPLALVLAGREAEGRKAAVGYLILRDAARFAASRPPAELARLGAVVFGGLGALEGPFGPVARLYAAGKRDQARALLRGRKDFWLGSDRWRRPPHPMESAPGSPLAGPFLREDEWGDADPLALSYLAPEFVKFLVAELKWSDPPL